MCELRRDVIRLAQETTKIRDAGTDPANSARKRLLEITDELFGITDQLLRIIGDPDVSAPAPPAAPIGCVVGQKRCQACGDPLPDDWEWRSGWTRVKMREGSYWFCPAHDLIFDTSSATMNQWARINIRPRGTMPLDAEYDDV